MPDWLLKKDDYTPGKDNDAFINKSIMSILRVLGKLCNQPEYNKSRFEVNALTGLVSVILYIIFISLSRNFTFVLITGVYLLVILNFLSIDKIKNVVKVSFIAALFTFLIFLPSFFLGYGNNVLMVTVKVLISVTFVNMFAAEFKWNDIVHAFKIFHLPDMFIFITDTTIRYIYILGNFALNLLYALKLRSVGRDRNKSSILPHIMGTMFLKSKDMSEEMYDAMKCRGFTGEYKFYYKFKFKLSDYILMFCDFIFLLTYFYFDRL